MKRSVLLAVLVLGLITAPAASAKRVGTVLSGKAYVTADRMPMPPRVVLHLDTPCPDGDAVSCTDMNTADVFLAPGATRFERLHELGHQFDRQVLTDHVRAWLTPKLGFPAGTPWSAGHELDLAEDEPAERFADAYAHCSQGTLPSSEISYGYLAGPRRHHRVCNAISMAWLTRPRAAS